MEENLQKINNNEAVIVEIRAGTGGEEAALFAKDLLRMYTNYAQYKGWKQKILDYNPTSLGGIKQVTLELSGNNVFNHLKYEGGVHRVQRIPKTEKGGRIHTSTVTVAVLQKPKKNEININPNDLKITSYKSSGPGGQYVNKTESAIRILHLPTGLVVTSQSERNQLQNRENALSILAAKILERKEQEDLSKLTESRREQIGWAERAEKLRTYNFPQDRITDHRIKKSWHNLEKILDGKMEPVIKDLIKKMS